MKPLLSTSNLSNTSVCVVGLGYVGLPLACLFANKYPVVGFDVNSQRVSSLKEGDDVSRSVEKEQLQQAIGKGLQFTDGIQAARHCNVYIVAVPTPVDVNNHPDPTPLVEASREVGAVIGKGDIVVYESTVYPGMTEEVCIPVVEQTSGLHFNEDFFAGYSPERINPGDSRHRVENIVKVTSGSTPEIAQQVDDLYNSVLRNGTFRAPSIRVAEASKIVENAQRDVIIAFTNELAKIFNAMCIDTYDVLEAAATKWNFVPMQPGLVGGHCISVDPYYLIQKAQVYGVLPRVMTNARRLNDSMGNYVANQLIRYMNLKGVKVKDAKILILGFTFKENCPDIRNTKVLDIIHTLREYTTNITVLDPQADVTEVKKRYDLNIATQPSAPYDAAILAVAHAAFSTLPLRELVPQPGVIYDVKGVLPREIIDGRL